MVWKYSFDVPNDGTFWWRLLFRTLDLQSKSKDFWIIKQKKNKKFSSDVSSCYPYSCLLDLMLPRSWKVWTDWFQPQKIQLIKGCQAANTTLRSSRKSTANIKPHKQFLLAVTKKKTDSTALQQQTQHSRYQELPYLQYEKKHH